MRHGETPPSAKAWPVAAAVVVAGVLAVWARRFERVTVAGTSMVPTLLPGDRLLVWRGVGRRPGGGRGRRPGRGGGWSRGAGGGRRLAGCRAGDLVVVRGRGAEGVAPGQGAEGLVSGHEPAPVVKRVVAVGAGGVTVAGDNPAASTDSRDYGPVPLADVRGRVVYRYAPAGRVGRLSGQ